MWSGNRPLFCSEVVGGVAEKPVVEVGDGAEQDGGLVWGELGSWGTGCPIDLAALGHFPTAVRKLSRREKVAGLEQPGETAGRDGVGVGAGFHGMDVVVVEKVIIQDMAKLMIRCLHIGFMVVSAIQIDVTMTGFVIDDKTR